jgi:4-amino-4-deoxy-L-arabinose transferase-like glycosyltransferase
MTSIRLNGIKQKDIIFWSSAFFIVFWALGSKALGGSEGRWAEVCRNMLMTGDYFHPAINGVTYFDKPLFSYWAIVGISLLTGVLNEFIIRLPSAIAALTGVWATVGLSKRLWPEKIAHLSGWIMLTTYGFLWWARTGAADMENMTVVILAVYCFFVRKDKPGFVSYLVFYLIIFLGAQFKGLPAVAVPLVVLAPYLAREKRWEKHFRISNFAALFIGVAVYFAPFAISTQTQLPAGYVYQSDEGQGNVQDGKKASGLKLVYIENIKRFFNAKDHRKPFYKYFEYLPQMLLPWSPFFVLALLAAFLARKNLKPEARWLSEAIVLIFILFSLSSSKRWYYILPALPFCVILTSWFLYSGYLKKLKRLVLIVIFFACLAASIGEVLFPVVSFVEKVKEVVTPIVVLSFIATGILSMLPWFVRKWSPGYLTRLTGIPEAFSPCVLSIYILMTGFFCLQYVELDKFRTEKVFALKLKKETAGIEAENIAFYLKVPPETLYYMQTTKPVQVLRGKEEAEALAKNGKGIFLTQQRISEKPDIIEKRYPWEKKKEKHIGIFLNGKSSDLDGKD